MHIYMTQIKLLFVLEMFKETNCLVKPYCDPTSSNKALLFNFCLGNKNTRNVCNHLHWCIWLILLPPLLPIRQCCFHVRWPPTYVNDLGIHPPIFHVEKPTPLHRCFEPTLQSIRPFNEVVKASRRKNRIYSQKVGDESIPLKPDTKVSW